MKIVEMSEEVAELKSAYEDDHSYFKIVSIDLKLNIYYLLCSMLPVNK